MKFKSLVIILITTISIDVVYAEKIKGTYTKSFERYDIVVDGGKKYFIEDPKNLISELSINKKFEKSFFVSFPICIEGKVSASGHYGPSGNYQQKIRLKSICN